MIELKEADICCGSAGVYNVVHNEMSDRLLENKMRRIDETRAELVLTANPGCLLQLARGSKTRRQPAAGAARDRIAGRSVSNCR